MFRGVFGVITVVFIGFLIKYLFTIDTWFMFFFVGFTVSAMSLFVNSYVMLKKSERKRVKHIVKKTPFSMIKKIFNKWTLTVLLILFAVIAIIPYFYYLNLQKISD